MDNARMTTSVCQTLEDSGQFELAEREWRTAIAIMERLQLIATESAKQSGETQEDWLFHEAHQAVVCHRRVLIECGNHQEASGLVDHLIGNYVKLVADTWTGFFERGHERTFPGGDHSSSSSPSQGTVGQWYKVSLPRCKPIFVFSIPSALLSHLSHL